MGAPYLKLFLDQSWVYFHIYGHSLFVLPCEIVIYVVTGSGQK